MNILFLGNKHSEASEICLRRILREDEFSLTVCLYDPIEKGPLSAALKLLNRYGIVETVKKCSKLASSKLTGLLRSGSVTGGDGPIEDLLAGKGIRCFPWVEQNRKQTVAEIRIIRPDVIAVANFSMLLGPELLSLPPKGCINVHPSLLPRYRGPVPVYWIVRNRESQSGVTVHYMIEKPDAGDIILQKKLDIAPDETESVLTKRKIRIAADMLADALHLIRTGEVAGRKQDEREATYYSFPRLQKQLSRRKRR